MNLHIRTDLAYWWSGNRSERYWIEQLKTDKYGERLIAPDNPTYAVMRGVEIGDLVFRWYSERHTAAGARRSGIYAVSRVIGDVRPSEEVWEGHSCLEVPVSVRTLLSRPILLQDIKPLEGAFLENRRVLATAVGDLPLYSPWQFPVKGLKPMTRYLTKLAVADLESIIADHPHLALSMISA